MSAKLKYPEILKRAVQLKALYDGYLAKQQQIRKQIEEVLGEGGTSALINVKEMRQIIGDYAALLPNSHLESTSESSHSQGDTKESTPTLVDISDRVTSYHLYASVRKGLQTSIVVQSRTSASANGVPDLHSNTAGSFTHPRSLPVADPSANHTAGSSSSTSTSGATQEQQPTEQNGSESKPVKR